MFNTTREELAEKLYNFYAKYPAGSRYGANFCADMATLLIEVTEEPLSSVSEVALQAVAAAALAAEVTNIAAVTVDQVEKTFIRVPLGMLAQDLNGKTFILYDDVGSVGFWCDIGDSGTTIPDDAAACDRAVEITTLIQNENHDEIATKLITAINSDADFGAAAHTDDNALVVTEAQVTIQTIAGNSASSGLYVAREQEGTDGGLYLDGKGFILYDTAGSVGCWIDVDDSGTTIPAWAAACDRAIEIITIVTGNDAAAIGLALRTKLALDAQYGTSGTGINCIVTDAANGARIAAVDVDSGFTITRTTEGALAGAAAAGSIDARLLEIGTKINEIIAAQSA